MSVEQQRFYQPLLETVVGKPCIIYPARDENPISEVLSPRESRSVEKFVGDVITPNHGVFHRDDYIIAIPWNHEGAPVLDAWGYNLHNTSESGPLITAHTFDADGEPLVDIGTTSGDALVVLGHEELLRRRSPDMTMYFARVDRAADLPPECRADDSFYNQEPIT
ncbi:MAG TPA: hypothetical protein VHT70_05845 [Candidatus Saccharimonadales bacterium]|jgi:hypothetical protein|nr:hypothetical protein [Candidatus Saccharimonadales bacterium]